MAKKSAGRIAGERKNVIYANQDPLHQAMMDGEEFINLNEYRTAKPLESDKKHMPLSYIMLHGLLRNYFINKVKAPLMKAIIMAAKRYPKPSKENCYYQNTLILMDIFDRFLEHIIDNRAKELFTAARDIFCAEVEHDIFYAWIANYFAEELYKEIQNGNYKLNDVKFPIKGIWKENNGDTNTRI